MKKLLVVLLCLTMLLMAVPAKASPVLFGEEVPVLTIEQMEQVEGEFKGILMSAAAGSLFSTANYLITTPARNWTVNGAVRNAISGAVIGAAGFAAGR